MRRINLDEATTSIGEQLNKQYNNELESALIYEQLSHKASLVGFSGLASYFEEAAEEENIHAKQFSEILRDLEIEPKIRLNISELSVPSDFKEMLIMALNHEKKITNDISTLLSSSKMTRDLVTEKFLLNFMSEQVEEEAKINKILVRTEQLNSENPNYLLIDKELSE